MEFDALIARDGCAENGGRDRFFFDKTGFLKSAKPLPTVGDAVDHIGLSVPSLATKIKELQTASVKVVAPLLLSLLLVEKR
jgi:hypothetical protein